MGRKKDRLLEIQQELISLEHLLIDISEEKRRRDALFEKIKIDLGKLMRKDYVKEFNKWSEEMFETKGIISPDDAMQWLKSIFQECVDKLK